MKMKHLITLLLLSLLVSMIPMTAMAEVGGTITKAMPKPYYRDLVDTWYADDAALYGYPDIFAKDALFSGNNAMTRMEFARLLHQALGIQIYYFAATDIRDFFGDVTNDTPGAGPLYDLVVSGILESADSFHPDQSISRQEMVHWILKALDYRTGGQYALILMMPAPFDDDASIADEYKNDIMKAQLLKLIQGRGNNLLHPLAAATRAEGVTVVSRLMNQIRTLQQDLQVHAELKESENGLHMRLLLQNHTQEEIVIQHNSGQKYDFKLLNRQGEILYTWSADKLFTMALTQTTLAPNETLVFEQILSFESYEAIKDQIYELQAFIIGTSEFVEFSANGYSAFLLR
mgnify:CR=1 FL=1